MTEEEFWQKMDDIWDDDGRFYDRAGEKITFRKWALLFHDKNYQVLKQTQVGEFKISTVWLGMDHGFGFGDPVIFETMIFKPESKDKDRFLDEQYRYATEEEALEHHEELVAQARLLEEVEVDSP